jgi:curved DNA-binding protein CbpA
METYTQTIENAHRTLGLRPFATDDEIRKAWRAKIRETHPDHGGSADAFRVVQLAAQMLMAEGVRECFEAETSRTTAPPSRPRSHRYRTLLAGAIFGYLFAPHLSQFGVTWSPLRDIGELMQHLESIFLIGWLFVKKRNH